MSERPVVLVILDGFGIAPPGPSNAVSLADTPVFDGIRERYPHGQLVASGRAVGLPEGQMGNSEVGHLTIGCGRIVRQDLVRLSDAVADGSFVQTPALVAAARRAKERGAGLHLMGLVSDGGVHSHVDHLRALVDVARAHGVVATVHAITDGRDVSPHQAAGLLETLEREWADGRARIATVSGRIYAMDRDRRWERTQRWYDAVVNGVGAAATSASAAVAASYAAGVTDEFVEPAVVRDPASGRIRAGDELVFFNFRPDRARQVCRSLADPAFAEFDRGPAPPLPHLTSMTAYWDGQPGDIAFAPEWPEHVLADALEEAGIGQLHAAETEKYAHVTYFLNGGREPPHEDEERILAPSPRDVKTYDLKPEMSAHEVAARTAEALRTGRFGFCVVNFANPDMVGHTGVIPAVVRGCEAADAGLGVVLSAVRDLGGVALVTADHGNAETMREPDGSPHTAHTTNPVPLVVTMDGVEVSDGGLSDLAPTILDLLGVPKPAAMTGRSLVRRV
jgi:2,3-bisphosphoglycerate-independent phosphoglycerate mutase